MPKKNVELEAKIRELQLRKLRQRASELRSTGSVPTKKKSKPVGYKMQNTFEENLKGVPGGKGTAGIISMVAAKGTGTKVRKEGIGVLRSARNSNTTSGSYISTIVTNTDGTVESDRQGRKAFGR